MPALSDLFKKPNGTVPNGIPSTSVPPKAVEAAPIKEPVKEPVEPPVASEAEHALTTPEPVMAKGVVPPDAPPPQAEPPKIEAPIETEASEPKKRGRPRKEAVPTPTSTPPELKIVESPKAPEAVTDAPLMLFIDCMPVKGMGANVILFEDWVGAIATDLAKTKQVEDYRLLPFGTGKGELAIAIRNAPVPSGIMIVNKMAPGADEALGVLIPKASIVVRGLK